MLSIRRREFIAVLGGAASWPFAIRAQQGQRLRRIAWLGAGRVDEPSPYLDSLRAGLGELGWIEGRNLTIGRFWATGLDNMEAAGRELLASDPEVIVAQEFTVLGLRSLKTTKPVRLQRRSARRPACAELGQARRQFYRHELPGHRARGQTHRAA
jgi:hypothetical protein